jgi:hypothetical protein
MLSRIVPAIVIAMFAVLAVQAKDALPTATMIMQKGYDKGSGLGSGTAQFYDYAPDNRCTGRKRLYKFSLITGAEATKPVPAGTKIVLSAYTNRYTPGGGGAGTIRVNTAKCENRAEFTPVKGETYKVVQKVEVGKSCTMEVVVQSTGQSPADLITLDPANCTKK